MNTWTPLWSKVVDSSIWMEDKNTRILFVTMLALKDRDHVVRHSAFELARKANLTELEVIESLKVLQDPDTKRIEKQEFEGRRIKKVDEGWFMLNGEKYRRAMQELYRKEYKRIKQAEYREKPAPQPAPVEDDDSDIIEAIYDAYPKKVGKPDAIKAITKALKNFEYDFLLERTRAYAAAREGQDKQFTPYPATWFNEHRFNDDPSTWKNENRTDHSQKPHKPLTGSVPNNGF